MHYSFNQRLKSIRRSLAFFLASVLVSVSAVALEPTLVTNIQGYRYVDHTSLEKPGQIVASHRTALAPRSGHWQTFKAILIDKHGRIADVFTEHVKAEPTWTVIDGQGRTMLPGLIDAHGHVLGLGQRYQRVDLVGATSVQEAQRRVGQFAEKQPEKKWVLGRGWNQVLWPSKQFPTAADLDEVISDRPVFLRRIDGHAGWANTAALEAAKVSALTEDPNGGQIIRDADGNPTGVFVDHAMNLIEKHVPAPDEASIRQALDFALKEMREMGITSVHDAGVQYDLALLYKELAATQHLTTRIYGMVDGADDHIARVGKPWTTDDKDLFALSSVKLYADGALGSRGAAMLQPYSDEPGNSGLLFSPYDALALKIRDAVKRGFQVNVHAIGDAANRQVLDIFSELDESQRALRHRIEHAQIISLEDLERFVKLGVIPSMQPVHATSDMNMAEDRVGSDRIKGAYAWRTLLNFGARIAAGSDFPVELSNPFHGLFAAVTRQNHAGQPEDGWYAQEAMTRAEALRSFTLDAAYAAGQENIIGNLQPGMWADFILLDEDFFSVDDDQLWQLKVSQTWLAGQRVYDREAEE